MSQLEVETQTAKLDLSLSMAESKDGLIGTFNYNTDLFDAATIRRMAGHFECLLDAAVSNPDEQIARLRLLTETEKNKVLFEWNDARRDYGKDDPLHLAFAEQARLTPDAVAVRFEQTELTYRELNQRANQLGYYLRKMGVGPEVLVGIFLERSTEMLVALLGVLKAGAAYVPLDATSPSERLSFIIKDAGLSLVLTRKGLKESLAVCDVRLVFLDSDWADIAQEYEANFDKEVTTYEPSYVVYT